MRKVLIAIGLLACTGLAGCDEWDRLTGTTKAAPVACNCAAPIRGARDVEIERTVRLAPPRQRSARHHATRRYAYGHAHSWHESYAERSVDIYGYSSHSQSYGAHGSAYGERYGYSEGHGHGGACCERGGATEESSGVWADGYGRRHRTDQSAVSHYSYEAHQRALETPERLDPWHGYNDDWD